MTAKPNLNLVRRHFKIKISIKYIFKLACIAIKNESTHKIFTFSAFAL